MISDTLAFIAPGPMELIGVLMVALFFVAIPIALIVLVIVYVSKGSKEKQKLHQKMAELTDELKRTQEQLQSQKKD